MYSRSTNVNGKSGITHATLSIDTAQVVLSQVLFQADLGAGRAVGADTWIVSCAQIPSEATAFVHSLQYSTRLLPRQAQLKEHSVPTNVEDDDGDQMLID